LNIESASSAGAWATRRIAFASRRDGLGLDPKYEKAFRANKKAWAFFNAQANWYRRNGVRWIMEGKAEETRLRRLQQLIQTSADERRR